MKKTIMMLTAILAGGMIAFGAESTLRPPVQTFYVPLPEEDVLTALTAIHGGTTYDKPSSPMESYVSISVFVDGTVIYYDQWEDGYERKMNEPNRIYSEVNQSGTQIWGDHDPSNGYPPGMPSDTLNAGDVITLNSSVVMDRIGTVTYFDGGDKFGATKPVAATRSVWAAKTKTLFAGANEMYDTTFFGAEFVCPVGEDIAAEDQVEVFEYTGLSIMAGEEGAVVEIDANADGTAEKTVTLAEGEAYLVNGGVKLGATVRAMAGKVQVDLITGDIYDAYESRFIKLLPRNLWANAYTCPVVTPTNQNSTPCGTKIWLYNPNNSKLNVKFMGSNLVERTLTVNAKGYAFVIPAVTNSGKRALSGGGTTTTDKKIYTGCYSGTRFTADGDFYAVATVDAMGTTTSSKKSTGQNRTWDWGFTLIPDASLTSQLVVGLGLGRDPTSTTSLSENGAPVWVAVPTGTKGQKITVYADYDGNPTTGSLTDANGNKCDIITNLYPLQVAALYNKAKGNQTGMLVYTLDGSKLASAWGSDPRTASAGQPGLDMGTGIPPMPEFFLQKFSRLAVDADGDGYLTPGDTLEYTISVLNVGRTPITDVTLRDTLPQGVTYQNGTLAFHSTWGSEKPLADTYWAQIVSEDGLVLSAEEETTGYQVLNVGESWTYTYNVLLESDAEATCVNVATAVGPYSTQTATAYDPMRTRVGDYVWLDTNGNGIQDEGEPGLANAIVTLCTEDGVPVLDDKDQPYRVLTDASGAYLFRGVREGTYIVKVEVPEVYTATVSGKGTAETGSDVTRELSDNVWATEPFAVEAGVYNLDMDAGFVVDESVHAGIALVKTAGDAADGDVLMVVKGTEVTYTYRVTNTGGTWLSGIAVNDDKLGFVGTIDLLGPGESVELTAAATIRHGTTNVGTAEGTPSDREGRTLTGDFASVSDTDDAVVKISGPDIDDKTASLSVLKLANGKKTETLLGGGEVTYTYEIKNTGETYLADVTVTDDRIPGWTWTSSELLAPGASVVAKTTVNIAADTENTGKATAVPADADGDKLDGVTIDGSDTAFVDVVVPGAIGDRVWQDKNGNGIQDEGEPGVAGVQAKLWTKVVTAEGETWESLAAMKTGEDGLYGFTGLEPGSYKVDFQLPRDYWTFAPYGAGSDPEKDSDVSTGNMTDEIELGEGQNLTSVDAGVVLKSGAAAVSLEKAASEELVESGASVTYTYKVTNTGSTWLRGVKVTDDKLGDIGELEGLLKPGDTVKFTADAPIDVDTINIGTVTGIPVDGDGEVLSWTEVTATDTASVRVQRTASIGDFVWVDVNGNGVQDEGEPGLGGVNVVLYDANGEEKQRMMSSDAGWYGFDAIPTGTYRLEFVAPAGYVFTTPGSGSVAKADGSTEPFELTEAGRLDQDAGLVLAEGAAAIEVTKVASTNRTPKNWRVTYTYTVKNAGTFALRNVTLTDDKLGEVGTVEELAAGESRTFTMATALAETTTNTVTATGTPVQGLTPVGEDVSATATATVEVFTLSMAGNWIWVDVDEDGYQDDGEPQLPGQKATLYKVDPESGTETEMWSETSNAQGLYVFGALREGDYRIVFDPTSFDGIFEFTKPEVCVGGVDNPNFPAAHRDSRRDDRYNGIEGYDSDALDATGTTRVFHLPESANDTSRDCGLVLKRDAASIQLTKTAGDAEDGEALVLTEAGEVTYTYVVKNTGKTYLRNVTVTDDKLGEVGVVEQLAPGAEATLIKTATLSETTVNVGTAEGTPCNAQGRDWALWTVTDTDDATVEVNGFGSIGDRVWADVNGNGLQDEGELGVSGVLVRLIDAEGVTVDETRTDAEGGYLFSDVMPGTYRVQFVPGGDWGFAEMNVGDDRSIDSDANPETGITDAFELASGEEKLDIDCGLQHGVPPAVCDLIGVANKFNAVVKGRLTTGGGDCEGNLLVVGDAELASGYSVGLIGPGYGRSREAALPGTDALVVSGNLTEHSRPDINGNIVYGNGYTNKTGMEFDARAYLKRHVNPVTLNADWNVPEDGTGTPLSEVTANLDTFSKMVEGLLERGAPVYSQLVDEAEIAYPTYFWTGSDEELNVFCITNENIVLETNWGVIVDVPAGSKLVVNVLATNLVLGSDAKVAYGSLALPSGMSPSQVLFNFPNLRTIASYSCEFPGSFLAPVLEEGYFKGAAIDGFAYLTGDISTATGFEFHDYALDVFTCEDLLMAVTRPSLRLKVLAGDAADGDVLSVLTGSDVTVEMTVENTGRQALTSVKLTDVTGRVLPVDELAPGASWTATVTRTAEEGTARWMATAVGTASGEGDYAGYRVEALDGATVCGLSDVEELEARQAARAEAARKGAYVPRPDLEISSFEFIEAPTITGEVFGVKVRLKNSGEVSAKPGKLGIYVGWPEMVPERAPADQYVNLTAATDVLQAGQESHEYVFNNLRASATAGACHVRAFVDADGEITELSEGNNQLPLFAWLSPISLEATVEGRLATLKWNSYEGQQYRVSVSTNLVEGYFDYATVPATPPENELTIDLGSEDVVGFFRLHAEILNDTTDLK